jgi:hypothetical protein
MPIRKRCEQFLDTRCVVKKKEMKTMQTAPSLKYQLKGVIFAAQACSCSCDPCTCGDPCKCAGADAYVGSRWRFVGDHIESGTANGIDASYRTLLNLAQTSAEKANDWHEVILIDDKATLDQVKALLEVFENQQGSDLAHPDCVPSGQRAVYLVPMQYRMIEGKETLCVTFAQDRSCLVRGNASEPLFKEWIYNGHVAVQQPLG